MQRILHHLFPFRPLCIAMMMLTIGLFGANKLTAQAVFKIEGKTFGLDELAKQNQGPFYDLEVKKYDLIRNLGQQKYLETYFEKIALTEHSTPEQARAEYLESRSKPSSKEIKEASEQFKNHPSLKAMKEDERLKAIADYLRQSKNQELMLGLIADAEKNKQLEVLYPEPTEPIFKVDTSANDYVRYGSSAAGSCKGDTCLITVVEYSEFQCPFCGRIQDTAKSILKEYEGKIRWIVRDFPLPSHERAKPAAIAAHCAGEQGRFWEMYNELFSNQRNLSDADFKKYALSLHLDGKAFEACVSHPKAALNRIASNLQTADKLGVTGTPTFFVNGRRVSGALPASEFRRVIDATLKK